MTETDITGRIMGNRQQVHDGVDGLLKLIDELRAALASAPVWHDRPTCAGNWIVMGEPKRNQFCTVLVEDLDYVACDGDRWYGPIPSDESSSE